MFFTKSQKIFIPQKSYGTFPASPSEVFAVIEQNFNQIIALEKEISDLERKGQNISTQAATICSFLHTIKNDLTSLIQNKYQPAIVFQHRNQKIFKVMEDLYSKMNTQSSLMQI